MDPSTNSSQHKPNSRYETAVHNGVEALEALMIADEASGGSLPEPKTIAMQLSIWIYTCEEVSESDWVEKAIFRGSLLTYSRCFSFRYIGSSRLGLLWRKA